MSLVLTEPLIRSRVNLTHENLEDIKSLSLPGTFHEKIVSIGTSLRKFSRLKSLDFSRNALESLQGLDHLDLLEKLNLYYNNVSTLEELTKLKHNQNLKELDLRLNPITRNEPDYRLYLIHLLPNLQKLDDRGVRDRERSAALTHFSSSQAAEMAPQQPQSQSSIKPPHPRTDMMSKLMKVPSVVIDDDVAVIDMMNRQDGDFGAPRPLTGSSAKEDAAEDYSLDALKLLNTGATKMSRHQSSKLDTASNQYQSIPSTSKPSALNSAEELYPHIMATPPETIQKIGDSKRRDQNLLFSDQVEAHNKYQGQGFFTPHPDEQASSGKGDKVDPLTLPPSGFGQNQTNDLENARRSNLHRPPHRRNNNNSNPIKTGQKGSNFNTSETSQKKFLHSLLDVVDRYWNGSQSLHNHQKFTEQAAKLVGEYSNVARSGVDSETKSLKETIISMKDEIESLRANKSTERGLPSEEEVKISLKRAKDDMARMHEEIKHYIQENRALQKKLDNVESAAIPKHSIGAASPDNTGASQSLLDDLHRQNVALNQEIDLMRSKVKQYHQVQELASMLQESHKSLVETNDHLLKELSETKHKHQKEIEQMHWSYDQMKSTMAYSSMSRSYMNGSGNTNNSQQTVSNNFSDSLEFRDKKA